MTDPENQSPCGFGVIPSGKLLLDTNPRHFLPLLIYNK